MANYYWIKQTSSPKCEWEPALEEFYFDRGVKKRSFGVVGLEWSIEPFLVGDKVEIPE